MNPFTTEHPLATKSLWFDAREHPRLSFVCSAVVLALILAPLVLLRLYYWSISDIGGEANPFPEPWRALFWGSAIAFAFSFVSSLPIVFLGRLIARRWKTCAFIVPSLLAGWVDVVAAEEPLAVSLVQFIANPKDYDGKMVRVIGFVRLEFEGNAIYLHQEDYKQGLTRNGLWIDVTDDVRKRRAEFDQKYVLVEGTFNAKDKGHLGLWSGTIEKIKRFHKWSDKDGRR